MERYATWELKNMIKALSMMEILNTSEENKRLKEAKEELKRRGRKWPDKIIYIYLSYYFQFIHILN